MSPGAKEKMLEREALLTKGEKILEMPGQKVLNEQTYDLELEARFRVRRQLAPMNVTYTKF